jgi:hypothetical protein
MSEEPDLVRLLYRADWTRLSLAAEVSVRRDLDLDRAQTEAAVAPPGHEWEMATDQMGTETRRSTLLIQPGRRYREQGEDRAGGCDGDRSWLAIREGDGWNVEADDGPEPPLPPMLRPSWLLTGYTLEAGEPVTVGEREAVRVVAFPRPSVWSQGPAGARPLDRVEMIVDLELGILLRHEEILDGRTLSVTELTGVRLDPDPVDNDRFAPPGGWDSARRSLSWAPRGPGWEAAKLFTGLAAGGIGALVRPSRSRPFEQATQEEPEAEMPPDSEPRPAGAPAVTDQVLHLLHDSRDHWATGITATLHQWHDMPAVLAQVPDGARRVGFGGLGYLIDAAGDRMATLHMVSRLSFDGSGRYRIEPALPEELAERSFRHRRETIVSDGKRQWQLIGGEMVAMPGGLPPHEIAKLLDASWLLEHRLSGGAETSAGGRRGYRLRVAANGPIAGQMFSTDEVVADAELGILLRMVCHAGSTPVSRFELRDVVVGGDIPIDIPEGSSDEPDDDRAGPGGDPARVASLLAREARSAFRSIFGGPQR